MQGRAWNPGPVPLARGEEQPVTDPTLQTGRDLSSGQVSETFAPLNRKLLSVDPPENPSVVWGYFSSVRGHYAAKTRSKFWNLIFYWQNIYLPEKSHEANDNCETDSHTLSPSCPRTQPLLRNENQVLNVLVHVILSLNGSWLK